MQVNIQKTKTVRNPATNESVKTEWYFKAVGLKKFGKSTETVYVAYYDYDKHKITGTSIYQYEALLLPLEELQFIINDPMIDQIRLQRVPLN